MTVNWNDAQLRAAKEEGAERLLQAALFFQAQHMQRLNVSNPRPYKTPSRPGEYPRKRTGFAQANVVYGPETVADIVHEGLKVRLGVRKNASYLAILEFLRDRKGFLDTMKELQPQIKAILE